MNRTDPIFRSLAMIEGKLQEKLTVAYLANGIHVSKYHYQRLFRETVGDSVMRYVTRRRLTLAAGELSGTGASILEIALRYGFDSPEGFSRSFKAHLGVTPSAYRKRHALLSPGTKKEDFTMPHTTYTESIIQDLNHLISQSRETAAYLRRMENLPAAEAYAPFWNLTASRTDAMADRLATVLGQINAISRHPDGISARFTLLRAIEGAAFRSRVTAFQAGLMSARAIPELRDIFHPACERCDALAQNAQLGAERLAGFFRELSALIFQDIREEASRLLLAAVEAGRAAAMPLSPVPYYAYIADELRAVTNTLSAAPLEESPFPSWKSSFSGWIRFPLPPKRTSCGPLNIGRCFKASPPFARVLRPPPIFSKICRRPSPKKPRTRTAPTYRPSAAPRLPGKMSCSFI